MINQPVNNFAVTVSNTSGTGVTPSGQARLLIDGLPVTGFVVLSSGSVTFSNIAFSSAGAHNVTAQFQDLSGSFASNTSNTVVQQVRDFSINITNPSGSALPTVNYDYSGTLMAINGYSAAVNITCTNGATTPPNTCALLSPSNPVPMGSAFTVRASHPIAAPTFSFNIQAASATGFSDIQSFPVTLNVGSFNFTTLNPSSASSPQGNPTSPMAFQVISNGSFSGEVDMSCSPPANVSCVFSNGGSSQALVLSAGQTINDTLVLNPAFSVPVGGPYTVTVKATPVAAPGQFQTRNVGLTVTNGGGTQAWTNVYFGNSPDGTTINGVNPPFLVGIGNRMAFDVSAYNGEAVNNSHNVNITVIFAEPVTKALGVVSRGTGGESCTTVSSVQINCSLLTITAAAPWIKTVTYSVTPFFGRSVDFTVILTESDRNPGTPTTLNGSVKVRYRPMLRPGLKPGNTNPK